MKSRFYLIIAILFALNSCKQENENTYKTYLAEKYQYKVRFGRKNAAFERNGWLIEVKNRNGNTVIHEYSPASEFYEIYSSYFPDGTLKETYPSVCNLIFDRWRFYDDYEEMYGDIETSTRFWNSSIKKEDIIQLLEDEGWFNRSTGASRIYPDEVLPLTGEFYKRLYKHFRIEFSPNVYKDGEEIKPPVWYAFVTPDLDNGLTTLYTVNGHTGEFTVKQINNIMKDDAAYYHLFEWQWYVSNPDIGREPE